MRKKIIILAIVVLLLPNFVFSTSLDDARLSGRILLQVESHGEAWYVNPVNMKRYYLSRPEDAYSIMREQGIGISNFNIAKIPVALDLLSGSDSDKDGLPDNLEIALGTNPQIADTDSDGFSDKDEISKNFNPVNKGYLPIDYNFASRMKGRIFLQVESHGEAWYVNPSDFKRYYLGTAQDAYNIMRSLGLGITDTDINKIVAMTPSYQISPIEKEVFNLINAERTKNGLASLKWSDELAQVAREHSQNLAQENKGFTGIGYTCDYPIIHHEGTTFGFYNSDRLNKRNIYYFSKSGENIALLPAANIKVSFYYNDPLEKETQQCQIARANWDESFKAKIEKVDSQNEKLIILNSEINKRQEAFKQTNTVNVVSTDWKTINELSSEAVSGWMNSEGHRRNILDKDFDESGLGIAYVNGYMIATQVFIKRADCGFKYGTCCQKTGYFPYCYTPLDCINNKCQ